MASESYDIRTADGKLFCKCQNNDGDVRPCREKLLYVDAGTYS